MFSLLKNNHSHHSPGCPRTLSFSSGTAEVGASTPCQCAFVTPLHHSPSLPDTIGFSCTGEGVEKWQAQLLNANFFAVIICRSTFKGRKFGSYLVMMPFQLPGLHTARMMQLLVLHQLAGFQKEPERLAWRVSAYLGPYLFTRCRSSIHFPCILLPCSFPCCRKKPADCSEMFGFHCSWFILE